MTTYNSKIAAEPGEDLDGHLTIPVEFDAAELFDPRNSATRTAVTHAPPLPLR